MRAEAHPNAADKAGLGRIPLSRCSEFAHLVAGVDACGTSPDKILRTLGMPRWHELDPDGFFPAEQAYVFAERAAQAIGTRTLGATIMEQSTVLDVGRSFAALTECRTIYQALKEGIAAFHRHGTIKQWWIIEDDDEIWFCQRPGPTGLGSWHREHIQYTFVGVVQIVRLGAGPHWRPAKVRIEPFAAADLELTRTFAEAVIVPTAAMSAIAIPRSILCLPLRYIPYRMALDNPLGGGLSADAPAQDFVGSLRQILATLVHDGVPSIEIAAEIAGLHVRSLQRALGRRGVTYRRLVDEARFESARPLLEGKDARITDVCYHLGYTDPAHFTRAFRRWAGVSPREYRRHRVGEGETGAS